MRLYHRRPRGTCRGCGRDIAVTLAGHIHPHGHYVDGRRLAGNCTGSGQPPKENPT